MPTPIRWQVPTELRPEETRVAGKLQRIGKFYVFPREIRGELFDDAFQAELAAAYQPVGWRVAAGVAGDGAAPPSPTIGALHAQGVTIRAKAWTTPNGGRFPKHAFTIQLAERRVTCPAQQSARFRRE